MYLLLQLSVHPHSGAQIDFRPESACFFKGVFDTLDPPPTVKDLHYSRFGRGLFCDFLSGKIGVGIPLELPIIEQFDSQLFMNSS